ncbi:Adenylate cyclase [Vibrio marisflavi CECT 7928]|uniref:Adenylate cyclase n=1 Tax=Vibrio marisflavi CECT 7928 TaxID=634439 RepID=A0ABN8EBS2_9VIBR|nr:Adenylate cyclase [Vibrio marisflavi CECT 7928]
MDSENRDRLTLKCALITDWAKTQGVEANFFLMDEQRFRSNCSEEMTGDNWALPSICCCFDEFYRSAVRLAGQRLLWQIVPPEMEENYDQYVAELCSGQYIDCSEWLDFGQLNRIPAEEYFVRTYGSYIRVSTLLISRF